MLDNNYYTVKQYVDSKCDLRSKIAAIDSVIMNLLSISIAAVGQNSDLSEYEFNDGQMRIKVAYRNAGDVSKDILAMERLKNMYVRMLNGNGGRTALRGGNIYY